MLKLFGVILLILFDYILFIYLFIYLLIKYEYIKGGINNRT